MSEPATVATHPYVEGVTAREEYIIELMALGTWHTRHTKRELAAAWGVSESAIQNYSAVAGRLLKSAIRESAASEAFQAMNRLKEIAVENQRSRNPLLVSVAKAANDSILKMTGFAEPDEDKQQAPTVQVLIGQHATSPAMTTILGRNPNRLALTSPSDDEVDGD